MEKKSRILIITFAILILLSIFFTYKRSFIDQDFVVIEEEVEDLEETEAIEEITEIQ